ncbi:MULTISPECIES: ANTAR domain-containing protein [Mycobacteriaceae]|uniref:ANTAR domain-containing protein n=1 Tax=Mycolicibacterium austroafricanum TaxID=39687 RepID=A0ABT8H8X5_MYCAO|nr:MULTISPECIES: ANTAR domain-containing protein [Mycobacteriaceae]MDN4517216.1 ANTAR domain-containing protein [Mycolicibacterium austroafricanum]
MRSANPSEDAPRAGARVLDAAQGVIIALRCCSLNQAFTEIVQAAHHDNVSPLSLADALVAIAQHDRTDELDRVAVAAARHQWGHLLDGPRAARALPGPHESVDDGSTWARNAENSPGQ